MPNNIYSLVAGGLLSAVIVPQIVKAALHLDGGQAFINKLVTLGLVVFAPVTILATLCAPLLATLYGAGNGGADVLALTTAFAYWCLPQIFFYAIYSLIGETLNARGMFGPFTWTPALNNVVVIAGLVVFIVLFGRGHGDAGTWTLAQVAVLAGSATLGIAVQAFGLLFFWRRAGLAPYRPDFRWRGVGLGATGRSAAWVFGMFLVSQVSGVVEAQVAFGASGSDASLAALKYAWLMFMLPHSVVTVSVVTAYFTRMSGHVRDGELAQVRTDLVAALRTILLFMVFSAVGLAVLAYPFSAVFGDAAAIAPVYLAYLVGLVPWTIFFVLLRVYYAVEDTRGAFLIQVVQTAFYCAGALAIGATAAEGVDRRRPRAVDLDRPHPAGPALGDLPAPAARRPRHARGDAACAVVPRRRAPRRRRRHRGAPAARRGFGRGLSGGEHRRGHPVDGAFRLGHVARLCCGAVAQPQPRVPRDRRAARGSAAPPLIAE